MAAKFYIIVICLLVVCAGIDSADLDCDSSCIEAHGDCKASCTDDDYDECLESCRLDISDCYEACEEMQENPSSKNRRSD